MRYIRLKEVCHKLSLSKATIWRMVATHDDFPKPRKLSPKCTVWLESEVDAYIVDTWARLAQAA